ncbi:1,4-alpha-glucan-branching enzyme [Labeo rohita]|uniref:1,4-alpha-glucan-branching enzyme n=1 Tax=Labeo rohita TaxID=84645 RepID=A0A498MUN6_LABRO|nr:1,4-alpha-glucan-branching enzyme [Labeo rohita]
MLDSSTDETLPNLTAFLQTDPYITHYEGELRRRYKRFAERLAQLEEAEGTFDCFTLSYRSFGIQRRPDNGLVLREWAPGAEAVFLTGDFNSWEKLSHPFTQKEYGKWELYLSPKADKSPVIKHLTQLKLVVLTKTSEYLFRISPWAKYVTKTLDSVTYDWTYWDPPQPYQFQHPRPPRPSSLRIYEAHVGISSPEERLPRTKTSPEMCFLALRILNYAKIPNFIHYFNYFIFDLHLKNIPYRPISRFGTPDDLKYLVDTAHSMGITVLLDVVHSHASSNTEDGLNYFDGTDSCFFHGGSRGNHSLWGSRLFNYSSESPVMSIALPGCLRLLKVIVNDSCVDSISFDYPYGFDTAHRK